MKTREAAEFAHVPSGRFDRIDIAAALRSKLSWKIALSVFAALLAIEFLALTPSYLKREGELLQILERETRIAVLAKFGTVVDLYRLHGAKRVSEVFPLDFAIGIAVYQGERKILGLQDEPPRPADPAFAGGVVCVLSDGGDFMDLGWRIPTFDSPDTTVLVRADTASVAAAMAQYILRVGGLVLIIAILVTNGTMTALWPPWPFGRDRDKP
ncbi:MAG: hypothetical protein VW405_07760, partial [Rhodospirillaceae bacterium]